MALAVGEHVPKVLVKRASERHIEHLDASTNRKHRLVESNCFSNDCRLELVMGRDYPVHRVGALLFSVSPGVDVTASLDQHTVARVYELGDVLQMLLQRRDGVHDSTSSCDGGSVLEAVRVAVTTYARGACGELSRKQDPCCHVETGSVNVRLLRRFRSHRISRQR